MLWTIFCNCSDAYTLVSGTITITGAGNDDAARRSDKKNKGVIFENCASFTNCISEMNNTEIDNAKYIDVAMPIYNLIGYSDNYSKKLGSLWQYQRDKPNDPIIESESFKYNINMTG